jgi:ABC-type Mn2+/Zn2+ transport system ATPase subunit
MKSFNDLQAQLQKLLPLPGDLPVVYLLGDTGAGKTCFVRQLLGTTDQSFPHVRRFRTTVAPTEFIITNEPELKAAFLFKSQEDISQSVLETVEKAVMDGVAAGNADGGPQT